MDLNNKIIITSNTYKKDILKKIKGLLNIKFYTFEEFIKHYNFDYDEKAIYYLMKNYNLLYDIAKTYIENMYYIEEKIYNNKLDLLVKLKKELQENNLIIKDNLFINYLKGKTILFYKYDLDKYKLSIIDKLKNICNVEIISKEYKNYKHDILEFNTQSEEVEYVAYKICELLNKGVKISDIKLANVASEYISDIKRIFKFYKIPINLPNNSIYGTKIVKDFLENYNDNIQITIEKIKHHENTSIYKSIVDICNKYRWANYNDVKELLINDLKNTNLENDIYSNAIEIIDYKTDLIEDEYVFLLNFNLGSVPKIYKDTDYITDNLKEKLNLSNTIEKNKMEKEITIKSINNIKNLTITYKLKTPTNTYYPSNLCELYTIRKISITNTISYSKLNDEIKLAIYLDDLVKYGTRNEDLSLFYNNYKIPYLTYNNRYTKVNIQNLYKHLDNKITLSYTSLSNYNECAFKFYLTSILKLNIYEDNFAAILGTIFHHILEIGLTNEINITEEIDKFIKENYPDKEFTNMEKYFIDKSKNDMQLVINTIKEQMKYCHLSDIENEKNINIEINKNIKINFVGKIDKILKEKIDDKTYIAIIDYKTGTTDIDLTYLPYGLHMQLPIYMYLSKNMGVEDVKIVGIYLQKVMPKLEKIDFKNKSNKKNNLKLEGYSNSDKLIIEKLDDNYSNSEVIKGLKTKNDGSFYSTSKILTNNEIDKLIELTEKQIYKCIDNILNANFDINPKIEGNDKEITACKFCKYQDICFRKLNDAIKITPDLELNYLGDDNNAKLD